MPDPTHKTVSASQIAALWNKSPYQTRWMLYHSHRDIAPADTPHSRMNWGKRMEPLLLEAAAEDLRLEIAEDQRYVRRGPIGCTRDATANDPQRGPGALETKCVFDYRQWMQRWDGGKRPPEDILLQVHAQMFVGDGETPFDWGTVAVWICGEMEYFPIERSDELFAQMEDAAQVFLDQVAEDAEPDPFGLEMELPVLKLLYQSTTPLTLTSDDYELGEAARMYDWLTSTARAHTNAAKQIKTQLLAAARTEAAGERVYAETIEAPGARIKVGISSNGAVRLKVDVLDDPGPQPFEVTL